MKREIKFRFWDSFLKEMIQWDTINEENVHAYLSNKTEIISPMQFTGLKDRESKEIYEGDILKCWDDCVVEGLSKYHIGAVIYHGLGFTLKVEDNHLEWFHNAENIEVIGNVHENPELLTVNN